MITFGLLYRVVTTLYVVIKKGSTIKYHFFPAVAPAPPVITPEVFIMPTPPPTTTTGAAAAAGREVIGRHDQDSVDGDHPDSGIDEDSQVYNS